MRKVATKMFKTQSGKTIEILADHSHDIHLGWGKEKTFNGVCVSACLSFMGVLPQMYQKTQNKGEASSIVVGRILRRFGYNVRSRKSIVKPPYKGAKFMMCGYTTAMRALKKFNKSSRQDPRGTVYYVTMSSDEGGHGLLVDREGTVLCDTAQYQGRGKRKKVWSIYAILPK